VLGDRAFLKVEFFSSPKCQALQKRHVLLIFSLTPATQNTSEASYILLGASGDLDIEFRKVLRL
jgi:hypothetical protein